MIIQELLTLNYTAMDYADKKIALLCLAFYLLLLNINAQSALLKGRIYSASDFQNISHANVVVKNSEGLIVTSITTGFDGRYKTDSIDAGAYMMEITSSDYEDVRMTNIYLQPGKLANVDVALKEPSKSSSKEQVQNKKEDKNPRLLDILGGILKTGIAGGF